MQLHSFFSVSLASFTLTISLLWLVIICLILRTQLLLILIFFRFRILCSYFSRGKQVSSLLLNMITNTYSYLIRIITSVAITRQTPEAAW